MEIFRSIGLDLPTDGSPSTRRVSSSPALSA
jgi:hypothetical protein